MYAAAIGGFAVGLLILIAALIGMVVVGGLMRSRWRYWSRPEPAGVERSAALADNTAVALAEAQIAIEKAWLGIIEWGADWTRQEDLIENCERLGEIAMNMAIRQARLRVTFGPEDDATNGFGQAAESAERVFVALRSIRGQSDRSRESEQARENFEANRKQIDSERDRFLAARARYEAAVRRATGKGAPSIG